MNRKYTWTKEKLKVCRKWKSRKVPTLRVKNTCNLKHEGKWDPFLSAVVCTWRRKGFPPSYPTFPSKLFRLAAASIGFNWSPGLLRRVHSLHKAGISYYRKKKRKDSTDLFQHHFYFYYDHKFYLFLVNWEEGLHVGY